MDMCNDADQGGSVGRSAGLFWPSRHWAGVVSAGYTAVASSPKWSFTARYRQGQKTPQTDINRYFSLEFRPHLHAENTIRKHSITIY
jgi:hypothetical protein